MLKVIGIVAVSWAVLSVLFVAFVWPHIINRINASVPAPERDRHLWRRLPAVIKRTRRNPEGQAT